MAGGSVVSFRTYTFPSYYANKVTFPVFRNRVKQIEYPGTRGIVALNMKNAEGIITHTGTVRESTQTALDAALDNIASVIDGTVVHSASALYYSGAWVGTLYGDSYTFGNQEKAVMNIVTLGSSTTGSTYFKVPFTITYVKLRQQ